MAVVRVLDRVRDGLEQAFIERALPDDEVEFDASIELVRLHADEGDEEACTTHTVVNIWVALSMPEMGRNAKSTCQVIVPLYLLETPEEVSTVGNDLWDSLQGNRVLAGLELPEADHPDGE